MCYTRIHERTKGVYMKNRKVFTLLLTGMLTLSMGSTVYASGTDAAIAEAQAELSLQHPEIGEAFRAYLKEFCKTL